MFGKEYTPRAQRVLHIAMQQAQLFNSPERRPEHLLLAIIAFGQGVAFVALSNLRVDFDGLRTALEEEIGVKSVKKPGSSADYSAEASQVMQFACKEAMTLQHQYVGTEHLLLGLCTLDQGIVKRVLDSRAITLDRVRQAILFFLDPNNSIEPEALARVKEKITLLVKEERFADAKALAEGCGVPIRPFFSSHFKR